MDTSQQEILAAYREHDRELTIRKFRVACLIGFILVPLFNILDHYVYQEVAWDFLVVRLSCSAAIAVFYWMLQSRFGRQYYRVNGILLFMLPASSIAWMIAVREGAASPYYAGLNLVLMVLAFVLDWGFWESFIAVAMVVLLYQLACAYHGFHDVVLGGVQVHSVQEVFGLFLSNTAFIVSTGIIIITGSYFHGVLRFREFASRYQLDRSRTELTAQNMVLENTLQQLKETELQLVQSEKIASLGRLSAGIIHEINNPINYASTGLYVLRKQGQDLAKDSPEEFNEVINDVDEGLQRVKNIVSDLRSFTHPDSVQRDPVKLIDVVNASLRFLSNEWKEKVQIEQTVPTDLVVLANKNKLTQVFVNLIQNALDALKNRPERADPPHILIAARSVDKKIVVTIRDNGEGIEPQNLGKIFDPFFTTRDVGKGMGMGLSICYRILQELEGTISASSERGKFCEFKIELPAVIQEPLDL